MKAAGVSTGRRHISTPIESVLASQPIVTSRGGGPFRSVDGSRWDSSGRRLWTGWRRSPPALVSPAAPTRGSDPRPKVRSCMRQYRIRVLMVKDEGTTAVVRTRSRRLVLAVVSMTLCGLPVLLLAFAIPARRAHQALHVQRPIREPLPAGWGPRNPLAQHPRHGRSDRAPSGSGPS